MTLTNALLIAGLVGLPIATGLLLRVLSRKTDYVADRRNRQAALNRRLQGAQDALAFSAPNGVKQLLAYASHFLRMADTALEVENVQRADVHQKLSAVILQAAEAMQDDKFGKEWWLDHCLHALNNMTGMKLEAALTDLIVNFETDPPLVIRQLGLSCLIWIERTRSNHENADAGEYELGLLPGKYAAANLE